MKCASRPGVYCNMVVGGVKSSLFAEAIGDFSLVDRNWHNDHGLRVIKVPYSSISSISSATSSLSLKSPLTRHFLRTKQISEDSDIKNKFCFTRGASGRIYAPKSTMCSE